MIISVLITEKYVMATGTVLMAAMNKIAIEVSAPVISEMSFSMYGSVYISY